MTHWLCISPHLDDAVLSCGGSIFRHVRSGHRVTVATVFTEGSESDGASHAARRGEDLSAAAALGFEAMHMGILDAPFRSTSYRDFEGIIYSDPCSPEAAALTVDVADRIEAAIATLAPDKLLVPLGVGGHIDHEIAFNACASLEPRCTVAFYEDRPYAFVPGAVSWRWRELGGRPEALPSAETHGPSAGERLLSESWDGLPFLDAYTANDADPARAVRRLQKQARSLTLAEREATRWIWRGHAFRQTRCLLESKEASALVKAIGSYASQVQDLFVGPGPREGGSPFRAMEPKQNIERAYGLHAADAGGMWYEAEWLEEAT